MNARQRQLRSFDYLVHMLDAIRLEEKIAQIAASVPGHEAK
jgi:hypothetical protein